MHLPRWIKRELKKYRAIAYVSRNLRTGVFKYRPKIGTSRKIDSVYLLPSHRLSKLGERHKHGKKHF